MKFCLVTPPFVQLNTPYPATTQLKAYLKEQGHDVLQCDIGIECAERIFSKKFLVDVFDKALQKQRLSKGARKILVCKNEYLNTIEPVWEFLQGNDSTLANRIVTRNFLPESSLFKSVNDDDLDWAYGTTGVGDKAKYLSTLYIEDLALFISEVLDCDFSIIKYQEQIALAAPSFDDIYSALHKDINPIEQIALDILEEKLINFNPQVVGFSIPFPGTLMMGLRMAQKIKEKGGIVTAMGGGYVNTELRSITDVRFFEYIDYLLFDDGELPLSTLASYLNTTLAKEQIVSCKYLDDSIVKDSLDWKNCLDFNTLPPADFSDLPLDKYLSLVEFTNPMHRLWSDGRWNKMTLAHGCYYAKCAFCDTSLDYIGRYSPAKASVIVDRMEAVMAQTHVSGFHFTDEALPPKLLKEVAQIIIERGLVVSFWGNVRFEKSFNYELCELLAKAGCIAVSGGLEVASARILKLINKGVTIEQAAECCAAFNSAGIMVHAYLMYGFPTQKGEEAVESLEIVKQMFEQGIMQSAFWHRYAMTVHSPTGLNPKHYNAKITNEKLNSFANNGIDYSDGSSEDWEFIGNVLKTATYNFMQGRGYELPMRKWFSGKFENPKISKRFIENTINNQL